MSYYTLYAHLKKISVKTGTILNGKHKVGENGSTGNAHGDHLHYQAINKLNHKKFIDNFDGYKSPYVWPLNPSEVLKKYATSGNKAISNIYHEPSPNDITMSFGNTNPPYKPSWPHQGLDYSGVEDKNYEKDDVYSLGKANSKVVETGYHYEFGNYVILEILGNKKGDNILTGWKTYDYVYNKEKREPRIYNRKTYNMCDQIRVPKLNYYPNFSDVGTGKRSDGGKVYQFREGELLDNVRYVGQVNGFRVHAALNDKGTDEVYYAYRDE